jgi:Xaa-Pro aminopeptidase
VSVPSCPERPPYAARRDRFRAVLERLDVDAALVTRLLNVRYLTGFTGSNAALLVTRDAAILATDGRYVTQAEDQAPDVDLLVDRAVAERCARAAGEAGVRRLGLEAHDVTLQRYDDLTAALAGDRHLLTLTRMRAAVEGLRAVKDDGEIALLRQACAIGDRALAGLLPGVRAGRTERDVARELERRMAELGADAPAFATIVAGGAHSAIPHHSPTDRPLQPGDLLKIDFGARFAGYHADMTRTYVVGAEPASWQQEIHDLVAMAQRAGREALAVGAAACDVDAAARAVVTDAGYGDQFPHGLGHGIGLEIHESPYVGATADTDLADRMVVTVEPGVYLPGRGGVRIEDSLVLRDLATELLTESPRDLVRL